MRARRRDLSVAARARARPPPARAAAAEVALHELGREEFLVLVPDRAEAEAAHRAAVPALQPRRRDRAERREAARLALDAQLVRDLALQPRAVLHLGRAAVQLERDLDDAVALRPALEPPHHRVERPRAPRPRLLVLHALAPSSARRPAPRA